MVPELPQDCIEGSSLLSLGHTTEVPHLPGVKLQVKQFALYGMLIELFMSVSVVLHIEVLLSNRTPTKVLFSISSKRLEGEKFSNLSD